MKILILATGGIAAHKLPSICSALKNYGNHEVRILTTENTWKFVTRDSLLYSAEILNGTYLAHIRATEWADKVVIVPATYNTINKIATGIADNEVTSACAAIPMKTPKILFPAMNTNMWKKEILECNLEYLVIHGWIVVEPINGKLACGGVGKGALRPTKDVVKLIKNCKPVFHVMVVRDSLIDESENVWYRDVDGILLEGLYLNDDSVVCNPDKIPKKYDRGCGSSYHIQLKHCDIMYPNDNYINSDIIV